MSNSLFTVAKVVEAIQTLPNGSTSKVLAALLPNGSLSPISNLESNRINLEAIAGDARYDLNYAAFQVIDNKYFYIPVEDLHSLVKRLDNFDKLSMMEMAGIEIIKNALPIVKGLSIDMKENKIFALF